MTASIIMQIDLPVYPERVYRAWVDSHEQSIITGQPAQIEAKIGGKIRLLSNKVDGEILTLVPFDQIKFSWHMQDMPDCINPLVELKLEPTCTGTEFTIRHIGIPDNQTIKMINWWEITYLRPLKSYFDLWVGEYIADMGDG